MSNIVVVEFGVLKSPFLIPCWWFKS